MISQRISISSGTSVVYGHFEPESETPFYIGHGSMDAGRPFRGGRWRTKAWRQHVEEIGGVYEVRILATYKTKLEALEHERKLLAEFRPIINVKTN